MLPTRSIAYPEDLTCSEKVGSLSLRTAGAASNPIFNAKHRHVITAIEAQQVVAFSPIQHQFAINAPLECVDKAFGRTTLGTRNRHDRFIVNAELPDVLSHSEIDSEELVIVELEPSFLGIR